MLLSLSSCKAALHCSEGSHIHLDSSRLWVPGSLFFFSLLLFLFARVQHTLTMLHDLGLWNLSTGHYDIPDKAGATGATRLPRLESSKWNVCFKDMTRFTRPQKRPRCRRICALTASDASTAEQQPLICFFFFREICRWPRVCCSDESEPRQGGAGWLHSRLAIWCKNQRCVSTLCSGLKDFLVLVEKRWRGLTAMRGQTKGDISGLLRTGSEATAALLHCRDDGGPN